MLCKIGDVVRIKRDFNFPIYAKYSGVNYLDHGHQMGEVVRHLNNGEIVVMIRGHEFAVDLKEITPTWEQK